MSKFYKFFLILLFTATAMFAQKYTISGTVTAANTGETLIGANVMIKNTTIGAATDENGKYSIKLDKGQYTVVCSYIGYETKEMEINLTNNMEVNFELSDYEFSLSVTVLADRAKERETPVAFTNVEKKQIETKLASREIPMVLNTTPSVYATQQGGGAGDARVNVRGFNQRNVAIMINGVPVNDMENGWVYWSNWDGIGDATSSIQVQRGLSAVNLATPSVGGTMNILTDPTAQNFGLKLKQELGNDAFYKTSIFANTGLVDNKWAVSVGGVRKAGDGLIDKTWTDAWAYYFGASYNIDDNNRLELYAIGAPQRHGQNLYKQNIGTLDSDFAKGLKDYDPAALSKFNDKKTGREYNQNWGPVSSSYKGKQYWNGSTHDRYDDSFINERENYYHKPQINLNWYSNLSKKFSLYTTAYYSGGVGGGSGTLGSIKWDYSKPSRTANWDATIAANEANIVDGKKVSKGILRNSVNEQWTIGAISKLNYKHSDNLKFSLGIDWRTAEIDHYREVRDLLGGDYYLAPDKYSADFWNDEQKKLKLGDKVNYYNTNEVNWLGGYLQTEYKEELFSVYGTVGFSMIKYKYTDHFKLDTLSEGMTIIKNIKNGSVIEDTLSGSKPIVLESDNMTGFQIKGGASYRLNEETTVYVNAGYIDRVPIFDNVIDDVSKVKNPDPKNEKITSFEGGVNYRAFNNTLSLKLSYYYTMWKDRGISVFVRKDDNTNALVNIQGLNQMHRGFEAEMAFQPMRLFRIDGAASLGIWRYTDDVNATYKDYENGAEATKNYKLFIKGLRVGDAPQTQVALGATLFPIEGLSAGLTYRYYRDFYADFNPETRTNPMDRAQSWKAPSYSVFDLNVNYALPVKLGGVKLSMFAHVFNLFDEVYVQDATDNSSFNAYSANGKTHSADDAEVFLGLPRTFNVGITLEY